MTSSPMCPSTDMTEGMRVRLSIMWIFAVLNYIYADVFTIFNTLSDPAAMKDFTSGHSGPIHMTPGAFLGFAVLMETSMVMVPLARFLPYRANRWANIVAGFIHTAAAILFFFIGGLPTAFTYYAFFVIAEVICTLLIIWFAWTWKTSKTVTIAGS
jgi:Family of unknown function (DUF6326)